MAALTYYMSWYTWVDKDVTTPWDFWFLSQGSRYRPRKDSTSKPLDQEAIKQAFENADEATLIQLDLDYVNDVKLLAFVLASSEEEAKQQVKKVFADAEFDKIQAVDAATQTAILQLIAKTLKEKAG